MEKLIKKMKKLEDMGYSFVFSHPNRTITGGDIGIIEIRTSDKKEDIERTLDHYLNDELNFTMRLKKEWEESKKEHSSVTC